MKCYVAGTSCPQEYPYVDACFANSSKEAKAFMWKNSHTLHDECDGDYMDLRVKRQPQADHLLDSSKEAPYIIRDYKTLRQMGWSIDGERQCDSCGLAAMDMDEFYVCDSCGQCPECGYDEECEEHKNS